MRALYGAVLAAMVALLVAAPVGATTVTATFTTGGGSLALVSAPPSLSWSWADNGVGTQHLAMSGTTESIDVNDARGTGAGWQLDLTSTTFKSGTHTMPTTAASVQTAPTYACDASAPTCKLGSDTVSYPFVVPAGTTAPAATAVVSAATTTGMGSQTVKVPFVITIPADVYSGTYSSTWTFTLVSGP